MKKRMIKYNLIVVMLIVFIPLVYFLSAYFESASQLSVLLPDNQQNVQNTPVETPSIPDELPNDTQINVYPQFKNGIEAVEYAIQILSQPISYECDIYHRTTCAGVGSVDLLFKTARYKNHELMRIWSQCSVPVKQGNFFKSMYSNTEQEQIRFNYDTSRFSYKEKTNTFIESDTIDGDYIPTYIENDKVKGWTNFFIDVNKSVSREIYFDKSNPNYYVVKVSMIQSKLNESKYADTMIDQGAISVDFKKINMTFNIDKKTGYMLSCTREEVFSIDIGKIDVITCSATGINTYRYIDTKDTILNFAKQDMNVGY